MMYRFLTFAALLSMSAVSYGQVAAATTDPNDTGFFVRYATNLSIGDSVINMTNAGTSSTNANLTGQQNGNLCANVYAYSPDEQLVSCCSCEVTPNGLNSLSVKNDLASNPLTPVIPSDLVVKILVTAVGGTGATATTCSNATAALVGTGRYTLVKGLVAWGTTLHPLPVTAGSPATTYALTETEFHGSELSAAELLRMRSLCSFIRANGSGYGICKSCRLGGLGASAK